MDFDSSGERPQVKNPKWTVIEIIAVIAAVGIVLKVVIELVS
jgi:uncharacterized membrane protein